MINNNIRDISNQNQLPLTGTTSQKEGHLAAFIKDCPNMLIHEAKDLINKGKLIEGKLIQIKNSTYFNYLEPNEKLSLLREFASPENAVALMWCLIDKAAEQGPVLTNGTMRISDGEIVRDFLKECGRGDPTHNKPHLGYYRISSHFKELLGLKKKFQADDPQMGLDLKNMNLPGGKQSVLFGLLPDGSVFIKMEERGCPPIVSWNNLKENLGHGLTYLKTRKPVAILISLVSHKEGKKIKRKEHLPPEIKKEFQTTIRALFPAQKLSFFDRLFHKGMTKQGFKIYEEGKKFGISKMNEIMSDMQTRRALFIQKDTATNTIRISKLESLTSQPRKISENIKVFFEPAHKIPENYIGDVKGDEVLLVLG